MRGSKRPAGARRSRELSDDDLRDLRAGMRGTVFTPGDPGYHEVRRVWNGLVDRYPAVVARCAGVDDVIAAVGFAREHGLHVAVRGGGHNVAGTGVSDGGLVVDCSRLTGVRVDPDARRAWVEPGVRVGDLLAETQPFGLAVPGGMSRDTGVAGSTLGGGVGWLRRKYGLGIDSLRSVDVVLADGRFVTASADEHPELFWAVRGAGGNFGVVTGFEFDLHPVGPAVATAMAFYAGDDAAAVLRAYREYAESSPDEVTTLVFLTAAPDDEAVPAADRGEPALGVMGCYAGPVGDGVAALRPLREFATPLVDYSDVGSFTDLHDAETTYPHGRNYYWKSLFLSALSDDCVEFLVERAAAAPSRHASLTLWQLGGAMGRVDASETAFPGRDAPFMLSVEAAWDGPDEGGRNVAWAREAWRDAHEFSTGTIYVNFPGLAEEGRALLRAAYGDNYDRLAELKGTYDPTGLFRPGGGPALPAGGGDR